MDEKEDGCLTLGSLFDGSGGFPLAGIIAGIAPKWASEIEPFPIRVTTKRLPGMKHYGDVSALSGKDLEPVDVITFGSPCQDLSLAGKRAGLEGSRSGLFHEAVRIIREMRSATNGLYPRFAVWENVPGAFSSHGGEDFRCVLEELAGIAQEGMSVPRPAGGEWLPAGRLLGNGYSIAWRVLDAQYWGVPQRRRRIFLVADLRGGGAGKILFESEGLSGYSPEKFKAWQRTANGPEEGTGKAGGSMIVLNDQGGDARPPAGNHGCADSGNDAHVRALLFENHSNDSRITGPDNVAQTVCQNFGTGGNNTPLVLRMREGCEGGEKGALIQEDKSGTLATHNDKALFQPKVYGICSYESNSMKSDNPHSGIYEAKTSRTLDLNGGDPACNQGGMAIVEMANGSKISNTLNSCDMMKGSTNNQSMDGGLWVIEKPKAEINNAYALTHGNFLSKPTHEYIGALAATDSKDPDVVSYAYDSNYIVRRLTPTECARLQGFPDWWAKDLDTPDPTDEEVDEWMDIWETHRKVVDPDSRPKSRAWVKNWLKHPHTDSAEYKMWGNGVALPCVYFVLAGIAWYAEKGDKK